MNRRLLRFPTGSLEADTAYDSVPTLAWLVKEKEIDPHIPVWDKSDGKEGLFPRSAFTFDADKNEYKRREFKLVRWPVLMPSIGEQTTPESFSTE